MLRWFWKEGKYRILLNVAIACNANWRIVRLGRLGDENKNKIGPPKIAPRVAIEDGENMDSSNIIRESPAFTILMPFPE